MDASSMFYNPGKMGELLGANGTAMPNGAMMHPPGAHANFNGQMNAQQLQDQVSLRQAVGRGQPVGGWPPQHSGMPNAQQVLMQAHAQQAQAQANAAQQQGQNAPTPGQPRANANHTNMPPPSAPATQANGRTPSSPSVNNQQPPTPTQANKAAPKRKDAKERKVNAVPVQAHATTPSEPPTPTSPGGNGAQNAQPAQQPPAPTAPPQMQQESQIPPAVFNSLSEENNLFADFSGEAGSDSLLDSFDFDTFLNTSDEGASAGLFDTSGFTFSDPVETGTGDS